MHYFRCCNDFFCFVLFFAASTGGVPQGIWHRLVRGHSGDAAFARGRGEGTGNGGVGRGLPPQGSTLLARGRGTRTNSVWISLFGKAFGRCAPLIAQAHPGVLQKKKKWCHPSTKLGPVGLGTQLFPANGNGVSRSVCFRSRGRVFCVAYRKLGL